MTTSYLFFCFQVVATYVSRDRRAPAHDDIVRLCSPNGREVEIAVFMKTNGTVWRARVYFNLISKVGEFKSTVVKCNICFRRRHDSELMPALLFSG